MEITKLNSLEDLRKLKSGNKIEIEVTQDGSTKFHKSGVFYSKWLANGENVYHFIMSPISIKNIFLDYTLPESNISFSDGKIRVEFGFGCFSTIQSNEAGKESYYLEAKRLLTNARLIGNSTLEEYINNERAAMFKPKAEADILSDQLIDARNDQNFELCAQLRDKIKKLKGEI